MFKYNLSRAVKEDKEPSMDIVVLARHSCRNTSHKIAANVSRAKWDTVCICVINATRILLHLFAAQTRSDFQNG